MTIEREERDAKEKNTLELLSDVKKKWHDREESKILKLRKDLEAANVVVQVTLVFMIRLNVLVKLFACYLVWTKF